LLGGLSEAAIREREEARKKREEEREKNRRAVIAVASKDIKAHIISLFNPYSTKGCLIHDINDTSEFEKAPFDITIKCQRKTASIPDAWARTLAVFTTEGVDTDNYIVYNEASYWPNPSGPITRGTQKFHIFTKYSP